MLEINVICVYMHSIMKKRVLDFNFYHSAKGKQKYQLHKTEKSIIKIKAFDAVIHLGY